MAAITRGSNVALPNSSLARSAWIAITSTMCRRRIAKCSSVIGFIGKSLPVQGGRSGAEIGCLSLTGADLAHGRERHPEVLRHLNRLHPRQQGAVAKFWRLPRVEHAGGMSTSVVGGGP